MSNPITIIAAVANNGVIGNANSLIWHLPEDLKRFKQLTMGHHVIMGRKTWESLPGILPGRKFIVISRQKDLVLNGAIVAGSLEEALALTSAQPVYIAGGANVYAQALEVATHMELTWIDKAYDGDAFFPSFDPAKWTLVKKETHHSEKLQCAFEYRSYQQD